MYLLHQRFGIIYEPYRKQAYFTKIVVLLRRAVLVAASIIFVLDQSARALVFTLLNFLFLALHVWLRPYKVDATNFIETVLLSLLVIISSVLSLPQRPFSDAMSAVLFLLVSGPTFFCIIYFAWSEVRKRFFKKSIEDAPQKNQNLFQDRAASDSKFLYFSLR